MQQSVDCTVMQYVEWYGGNLHVWPLGAKAWRLFELHS
jgi:hypothetical protein